MGSKEQALRGMRDAARIVARTYGPNGRTVLIDRPQGLLCTKDGFTVLMEMIPFGEGAYSVGGKILLDAVLKQNLSYGDGTTLCSVIAGALASKALPLVAGGGDLTKIPQQLDQEVEQLCKKLRGLSDSLTPQTLPLFLRSVTHEEPLADLLAEAVMEAGEGGHIFVTEGYHREDSWLYHEGSRLLALSPKSGDLSEAMVCICHEGLDQVSHIQEILEYTAGNGRPLWLIAPFVEAGALQTIRLNPGVVVHTSRLLNLDTTDLEVLTGAKPRSLAMGDSPSRFQPEWFGGVSRVSIRPKNVTLIPYDDMIPHVESHQRKLLREASETESPYDRKTLEQRSASLIGSLVEIRMGATTESEARERKGRLEDALNSTQHALRNGVIRGAAQTLAKIPHEGLLKEVIQTPYRILGEPPANTLDASEVVCGALQHGCSAVKNLIRSDVFLLEGKPTG